MKKLSIVILLALSFAAPVPAFANAPVIGAVQSKSDPGAALTEAAIEVTWSRVSGINDYRVTARTSGELDRTVAVSCANANCAAQIGGLSGGVTYEVIVASLVAGQPSSSRNFVAQTIPAAPIPAAPIAGVGQVTLSWTAPSNTGGLQINSYRITSSDNSITRNVAATETSQVISGLAAGTSYTFRIVAINGLGQSATASFAATTILSVPGAPTGASLSLNGSTLTASWLAPDNNGGSTITEYRAFLRRGGVDVGNPASTTATSTTFSSLAAGSYTFQVVAVNAVGQSIRSVESNAVQVAGATLLPNNPVFTPASVQNVEVGNDAVFSVSTPGSAGGSQITISVAGTPAGACALRNGLVRAVAVGRCVVTATSSATATHAAGSSFVVFDMFATASTPSSGGGGGGGGVGGGAPAASKPLQLTRSFFTGTVSSGQTVTGDVGTWEKSENLLFRYQWHRCNKELINPDAPTVQLNCSPIFGAEQINYLVTDSEKDKFLLLEVIARDKTGTLIAAANVFSDTVGFGKTATKPTTVTPTTPTAKPYGITRLAGNKARFQAFDPVGKGRISYRLNGREVAWINARNSRDKKIRAVNGTPAFSKTVTLRKGKNTLEIWVKGKRQSRVTITIR